ncbi:MAG: RagB/SusD family nutrient uptake outer membrane protein, partial [Bacteroidales bacterium]|nr:RagB/SusD family nutrient uptake outer membrane protein [Bacteroidales bacterium]
MKKLTEMKIFKYSILVLSGLMLVVSSCVKDLDTEPIDPDVVTSANVYDDPAAYKQVLARLYAGLALTGQQG